jgi:hypothetical protein
VPEPERLLGHGEAAPSAHVGPAALQGHVLEGACGDDLVFDKDGKKRTSRWASGVSFTWAVAWSSSTWRRARSSCPGAIFHLRNGLAAGALSGATGVGGARLRFFSTCATGLRPALLLGRPEGNTGRGTANNAGSVDGRVEVFCFRVPLARASKMKYAQRPNTRNYRML